jgi:hypothetical protein
MNERYSTIGKKTGSDLTLIPCQNRFEYLPLGCRDMLSERRRGDVEDVCDFARIGPFRVVEVAPVVGNLEYLALSIGESPQIDEDQVALTIVAGTCECVDVDPAVMVSKIVDDALNGVDIGGMKGEVQRALGGMDVGNGAAEGLDALTDAVFVP